MHEMGIMSNVLDIALDFSQKNDVSRVLKIILEVGEYSGIVPRIATDFFSYLARGTVAEGAEIEIIKKPLMARCENCGNVVHATMDVLEKGCPECSEKALRLLSSGRGWRMECMEVE